MNPNLKILTVAATPFFSDRGCHMRIYQEAKYLKKMGARIRICTYHLGKDIDEFEISRIGNVDWYRKKSPGFFWGKLWLDLKLFFLCIKEIRKYQPDVIHAHLFEGIAVARLSRIFVWRRIPILADLQGDLEEEFRSYNPNRSFTQSVFIFVSKWVLNWADEVAVSSDKTLEKVRSNFHTPDKVTVIRDGVDLDLYCLSGDTRTGSGQEVFEQINSWKNDSKLLVYAGSVETAKGVERLIQTFVAIADQVADWKMLVVGHGKDLDRLQNFVVSKEMESRIKFVGGSDYFDLPRYLELVEAAIDPKNNSSESSGKLVNYMTAGLPVICFENEFNRQLLGGSGLYMSSFSELENLLLQLSENHQRISYDLESISEESEVKKLFSILQKLADKKTKSPSQ